MRNRFLHLYSLFLIGAVLSVGCTQQDPQQSSEQIEPAESPAPQLDLTIAPVDSQATPLVLGYGVDTFSVGGRLFETDFSDSSEWSIQVEQNDEPFKQRIDFTDGMLDLYMPARGCTAWLKQKFSGPITIVYQVRCPVETVQFPEIQTRDINNFWHCSVDENETDIFDRKSFNGSFGSYSKLKGWYASTGGGGRKGNRTTRFRRYPREVDGEPCSHIALNDHDGDKDYLITPGKWHTIQLVAFGDIVQYIVDGKVVYEIRKGDLISVEVPAIKNGGERSTKNCVYNTDDFPPHTSGYFGFRMVRSHHQYKNLTVYRLKRVANELE